MNSEDQLRLDAAASQGRKDNYFNQYSGYGGSKDPVNRAVFIAPEKLTRPIVEDMYAGSWIVRRAVEVYPEDATRGWVDFKDEDADLVSKITNKAKTLKFRKHTFETLRLARLYGGAILVMGALDGQEIEEPLKEDNIKSFDHLFSVDRWNLHIAERYSDPEEPKFREPKLYQINPQFGGEETHRIHESRVIRFDGAWLPAQKQVANQGWHDSVLPSMMSDIKNFILSNQSAGQLLQDFITKVLKMPNLSDLIERKEFNSIEARIQYALAAMSNVGLSLIQGGGEGMEEDFDKIQTPITGFPDLLEKMRDMVCAAIRVPKVKLFGQQPGKMGGMEETLKVYNDEISAYQETELRDKIERLYHIAVKSEKGKSEDWNIEFNPLRKMTEKEQADVHKTQSEADEKYILNGVVTPEEVAESRFTDDGFKLGTTIDIESRGEMKEIEEEE